MDQRGGGPPRQARGGPAVGDELDEVAATEARVQYRVEGMPPLAADADVAPLLRPGERIFATRSSALVGRRTSPEGAADPPAFEGDLYLTSARLVLVGEAVFEADLEDVEEAVLAGDQLLLVMRDGVGLSLNVDRPRLLRVQIAAARAVARGPDGEPPRRRPR